MSAPATRQICFLSYSRRDTPAADLIHSLLDLYESEIEVWRDVGIPGGIAWSAEIYRRIETSTVFIAVISRSYQASEWCRKEFDRFHERLMRGEDVRIIPVRIDKFEFEDERMSSLQQLDFSAWLTVGDQLVSQTLVPAILGRALGGGAPEFRQARPGDAIAVAAMTEVLVDYRKKLESEQQSANLVRLALAMVRSAEGLPIACARLLTELSELFINKADYRGALPFNVDALERLRAAGLTGEGLSGASDDVKALLSGILLRTSIITRKLKEEGAHASLEEALRASTDLEDAILRSDWCAHVHREMGTYWQTLGMYPRARSHFEESFALLRALPTQRFHAAQAKIKLAQTELLAGEMEEAERHLGTAGDTFEHDIRGEPYGEMVHCQYLLTRTLLHAMRPGPRGAVDLVAPAAANLVRRDLDAHREIAVRMSWRNELFKCRLMRWGWRPFRLLPHTLQTRIVLRVFRVR